MVKVQDPIKVQKQIKDQLWYLGDLEHMLRERSQVPAYMWLKAWKDENPDKMGPIVWNMHRRYGKSRTLLTLCIERCLQVPGQEVRFGAPTYKQAQEISIPLLKEILRECPQELYPSKRGNKWTFQNPRWLAQDLQGKRINPSVLTIVSCKEGADDQRGLASDMVVLDECRDIDQFEYVVKDIFSFHFSGRDNPLLILSSTPPRNQDHAWVGMLDEAFLEGRYYEMTVETNPDFTKRDEGMLLDVCRSKDPSIKPKDTSTWKREALCMRVSDEASLIVPEFPRVRGTTVVDSYLRPDFYFPHMCVDFGWVDNSAVLFGYVDFKAQLLVIEDEFVAHYKTLGDIARTVKAKEAELYADAKFPVRRFGDNDSQDLGTLRIDHDLHIEAVNKAGINGRIGFEADSALAKLRTQFQEGKIRIHSRCKQLIYQLENGLKDEKGKWVRTEKCGHSDAIAALVYLNRMVNWNQNPFPWIQNNDPGMFTNPFEKSITRSTINVTRRPMTIMRGLR